MDKQEYDRRYYQEHKERRRKQQKEWYQAHKEQQGALNHKIKIRILSHYSGGIPVCFRCGITDVDVLCIDHINGGGTQHKKALGIRGLNFYQWLIKENFPNGFQVLCANCNLKKRIVEGK